MQPLMQPLQLASYGVRGLGSVSVHTVFMSYIYLSIYLPMYVCVCVRVTERERLHSLVLKGQDFKASASTRVPPFS
jgi:hypothetical protein